jgi:16S rRNA (cytosine1402-N4)-methyltransferase
VSSGGHALAILEKIEPGGKLLGIEWDPEIFKQWEPRAGMTAVNDNYAHIKKIAEEHDFKEVDGILFDLGISSWHIDRSGRGFSFQKEEWLDMRFNPQGQVSALEIVNAWTEEDLARIIKEYGEEGYAERIARAIIEARGGGIIKTSSQLAEIISRVVPKRGKINPATKTFQALRIVVNGELDNVAIGIKEAINILKKDGRLAVISFQGLEDRIVKSIFREAQKENSIEILTKKVIRPSWEEVQQNPRARSARMRVILKK